FDHVPPQFVQIPPADQAAGNQDGQLGFRVPCLIASPFARHRVSHTVFEHTSVLRMIEWRWGLTPLTGRVPRRTTWPRRWHWTGGDSAYRSSTCPTGLLEQHAQRQPP